MSNQIKQYMSNPAIQNKLNELLGERKDVFLTSALQAVNGNDLLQKASPESIFGAVVTAATLNLPINNNLGFAYIVPFKGQAAFQIGYKGFVQLAMRSGEFKRISACKTYSDDTEQDVFARLTSFLPSEPQGEVTGYIAYFKLLNGFEAHLAMSKAEVEAHAKQYSQTYKRGFGVWKDNFDAMATKTVIKLLLSKQAPLSIAPVIGHAVEADQATIRDVNGHMQYEYLDNQADQPVIELDITNNPAMFATVKSSIEAGHLDKVAVMQGSAGYIISDQQKQEVARL